MAEIPEPRTPAEGAPPPPAPQAKANRLYQTAAWVVIVAGIVFVVSVIFFAGAYLSDDGWRGHHRHGPCMMHMGPPPMAPGPDFGPGPAPGPGNTRGGPGGGPHHAPPRP